MKSNFREVEFVTNNYRQQNYAYYMYPDNLGECKKGYKTYCRFQF